MQVPVDMVVSATLAAMQRHGGVTRKDIKIYHLSSSTSNPLTFQHMFKLFYEHFKSLPCIDGNGKPIEIKKLKIFTSMDEFDSHLLREATVSCSCSNANPLMKLETRKLMEQAKYLAKIYGPFTLHHYRFDNSNTHRLMERMSHEEKKFGFDVRSIDWKDYIVNVHIPGLRRHVMKEKLGSSRL
ncbi:hypothetical protein REPUB_Repub06bG0138500 [Reevesia pubescens]